MIGRSIEFRTMDLRDLDQQALETARRVIAQVGPEHLDKPTPCAAWNLGELLRHLVSENRGFAATITGVPPDSSIWDSGDLGTDPYRAYQDSGAAVTAAFAVQDVDDRPVEVREFGVFPGRVAMGMHFVDFLIHGWDVAASIGVPYQPDEELVTSALAIASRWPDAPGSRHPGAAFDVQVPVRTDAPGLERLLGYVGRSPLWTTPSC